jgi:thymidylate synthase (FAD)
MTPRTKKNDKPENIITSIIAIDPLNDGKSSVSLIDSMGGDLTIVNLARTSYEKKSETLTDNDIKLIKYLIKHNHKSPLRGCVMQFRVKAPLYICRQWAKHIIASNHNDEQLQFNEVSRRYTAADDPHDYYIPTPFLAQHGSNHQSSGDRLAHPTQYLAHECFDTACEASYNAYSQLLAWGVSREQARGVLVPAFYSTFIWTASLEAVLHFIDLRSGSGAQSEIVKYADAIKKLTATVAPKTMEIWNSNNI